MNSFGNLFGRLGNFPGVMIYVLVSCEGVFTSRPIRASAPEVVKR